MGWHEAEVVGSAIIKAARVLAYAYVFVKSSKNDFDTFTQIVGRI
jgi:hypothetical protein